MPPGPPVLETLVAEVYGPAQHGQIDIARQIRDIFEKTAGVVDVDWYVEDDQPKYRIRRGPREGRAQRHHRRGCRARAAPGDRGRFRRPAARLRGERRRAASRCASTRASRSDLERLKSLKLRGRGGSLVALGEIAHIESAIEDKSIYHKNLMPVTYVTADVAGVIESPVYAMLKLGARDRANPDPGRLRASSSTRRRCRPTDTRYAMKWDGEWHITYEVFRDLGLAFAAVLILIYILIVGWFQSFMTPLVIMAAIPFSLVGILPAHGLLRAFFTATSMIGFIAGAGIVVRNSIILVDFIELRLKRRHAAGPGRDRRRRGPLPPHDADRGGRDRRLGGDSFRSDLSRPGDRADGRRNRFAGTVAHDRAGGLLHRQSKEELL